MIQIGYNSYKKLPFIPEIKILSMKNNKHFNKLNNKHRMFPMA